MGAKQTLPSTIIERDNAISEKHRAITERDLAVAIKTRAITERDLAGFEKQRAVTERDVAITERDNERDKEEVEEKTEFNLMLDQVPADKKIAVLKVVRSLTGLGLKEAQELVESAPKLVKESLAKDAAEAAKKQIEDAGGKASLT